jgi:hypothetical protein
MWQKCPVYIGVAAAVRSGGDSDGNRERRDGAAERSVITASRRRGCVRRSSVALGSARRCETLAAVSPFADFLTLCNLKCGHTVPVHRPADGRPGGIG